MSGARTEPEYVRAEVQRALAADPLLSELGIQIAVSEAMIELRGDVATAERRERAVELVHRLFPERRIENALRVPDLAPPDGAEAMR